LCSSIQQEYEERRKKWKYRSAKREINLKGTWREDKGGNSEGKSNVLQVGKRKILRVIEKGLDRCMEASRK
jgi:hypothetical protein